MRFRGIIGFTSIRRPPPSPKIISHAVPAANLSLAPRPVSFVHRLRDARLLEIGEGTSQIQRIVIAKALYSQF
jgi:alkylation response protein AidB-like acyl-CoA dehydrogenase